MCMYIYIYNVFAYIYSWHACIYIYMSGMKPRRIRQPSKAKYANGFGLCISVVSILYTPSKKSWITGVTYIFIVWSGGMGNL